MGGNYAPSIAPAVSAAEKGCAQVLWLYPEDDDYLVTEVRRNTFNSGSYLSCNTFGVRISGTRSNPAACPLLFAYTKNISNYFLC